MLSDVLNDIMKRAPIDPLKRKRGTKSGPDLVPAGARFYCPVCNKPKMADSFEYGVAVQMDACLECRKKES